MPHIKEVYKVVDQSLGNWSRGVVNLKQYGTAKAFRLRNDLYCVNCAMETVLCPTFWGSS